MVLSRSKNDSIYTYIKSRRQRNQNMHDQFDLFLCLANVIVWHILVNCPYSTMLEAENISQILHLKNLFFSSNVRPLSNLNSICFNCLVNCVTNVAFLCLGSDSFKACASCLQVHRLHEPWILRHSRQRNFKTAFLAQQIHRFFVLHRPFPPLVLLRGGFLPSYCFLRCLVGGCFNARVMTNNTSSK